MGENFNQKNNHDNQDFNNRENRFISKNGVANLESNDKNDIYNFFIDNKNGSNTTSRMN